MSHAVFAFVSQLVVCTVFMWVAVFQREGGDSKEMKDN